MRFSEGKPWQAFKNFAILFSFTMNLILLIVLLLILPLILPILGVVRPIVGGLNTSFVEMNAATISAQVPVNDTLDIAFTLPLEQETDVVVVRPVELTEVPASFVLPGGGGAINGTVSLALPQGLTLPVELDLEVPVEQTIPVELGVEVDNPLDQTELGGPFQRLVSLFTPLDNLLNDLPEDTDELRDRLVGSPAEPEETAVSDE